MRPAWNIVEFRGREGLLRLEADWKRLLATMPDPAAHHTYESHVAYFDHLSDAGGRYTCLALSDGERIRAICPLELRTAKILGRRTRVWDLPWNLENLLRDVICPPGDARAVLLPRVVEFLRRAPGRPALLLLGRVLETSAAWDCLRSLDARAYCTDLAGASAQVDCERPFDELKSGLSKNFKSNLRKAHNKLAALADVRFVTAADRPSLAREFEALLEVEASGLKGEAGTHTAIRLDRRLVAFYGDLAAALGDVGQCEINAVYAEGRCIAAQFCVRTGTQYAMPKLGYDERYARAAPGQLLMERTLQRCCDDPGIRRFTMVSDAEWFQLWRMDQVPVHCAYIGLGRWSGPLIVNLLRLRFAHGPRVKRCLLRLAGGLHIGRWLRRRVGEPVQGGAG